MYTKDILRIFSFLLLVSGVMKSTAQTTAKVEALNTYVEFLNESVHGLTVAHILFVNYNRDLNKYVDLDSHKLNAFMTNQEVGVSIFDNPDISTTDNNTSAIKLSKKIKELSSALKNDEARNFNALVDEIVGILSRINGLRFEIEEFINSSDLNNKENIYRSYELLEQAVRYFDEYHANHDRLIKGLKGVLDYKQRPLGFTLDELHAASVSMIVDLRTGNMSQIDKYIGRILGATDNIERYESNLSSSQRTMVESIKSQIKGMTSFVTKQIQSPSLPNSYALYGKDYYIHNNLLLTYFNSISPGFVSKINTLTSTLDETNLKYDDRPILYKVTYPEKMAEIESVVAKTGQPLAIDLPVKVKMDIELPTEPQQDYVELEFYDPNLIDRDSISVSINDEWILDNYKLVEEPKKFRIDIDSQKGNSVFIVAKNEGIIPPNTIGFKYRYNGKGKKIEVLHNLTDGTAYELVLTIDGLGGFSDKKIK